LRTVASYGRFTTHDNQIRSVELREIVIVQITHKNAVRII
jgi:hypothetical protein